MGRGRAENTAACSGAIMASWMRRANSSRLSPMPALYLAAGQVDSAAGEAAVRHLGEAAVWRLRATPTNSCGVQAGSD